MDFITISSVPPVRGSTASAALLSYRRSETYPTAPLKPLAVKFDLKSSFRNKASGSIVGVVGILSVCPIRRSRSMGWVPVSEHGINAADPADPAAPLHTVHTVSAMSVSGSTLYAAGYSSDSGTELFKAPVADERWTWVKSIPTLQRPLTMALHGGALYLGGYDNTPDSHSMLVRISLDDIPDIRFPALPVAGSGV